MSEKISNTLHSMDSKLENIQHDLAELEEDLRLASISGNVAAKRLGRYSGKIESVRVLVENLKKSLDNTPNT